MGREARREQRNNWLYKLPFLHSAPKGKLIELKQKEMQTVIKYSQTDSRAEEDHYVQAPKRKNAYRNRDNSAR